MDMKRRIIALILIAAMTATFAACEAANISDIDNSEEVANISDTDNSEEVVSGYIVIDADEDSDIPQQAASNTHYYKTIKIIGDTYYISPNLAGVIECDFGFGEYLPTLTIQYNTTTGMAESAVYCNYYSYSSFDEDGNEFLQADLEALSTGEGDMLSRFSNFNTEVMEAEEIIKLSFDIDISTYNTYMDSVVNTYLLAGEQNIEGYKDSMNYNEEGENYCYETHYDLRLEWED